MSDGQQPVSVTIEDAFQEACLALGEAIVRERLLVRDQKSRPTPTDG